MGAGDWKNAASWLQTAGSKRATPEWKKLEDEVRKHLESQPTTP
jgi:hypothetical protein